MKLLEKILLPTDFTDASSDALKLAVSVAKTFKSKIHLLHVIPEIEDSPVEPAKLRRMMQTELDKVQAEIQEGNIEVESTIIGSGNPSLHISQQANLQDVNLIIIGAGNDTSGEHASLGITAERVIRRADKPVWAVKRGASSTISKILCPVDFSPASERALKNAIHLARQFDAQLSVITVVPPLSGFLGLGKATDEEQKTYATQKENRFAQFLKGIDFHDVKWTKTILSGNAHTEIIRTAKESQTDLIVMGALSDTGQPRVTLGKVAEKVMRQLPCSIVTVKSEDPIRLKLEESFAQTKTSFLQGQELLSHGFAKEAEEKFQNCIDGDESYAAAWEGLAEAQQRQGKNDAAEKSKTRAKAIRQDLWERRVEAEVRGRFWGNL